MFTSKRTPDHKAKGKEPGLKRCEEDEGETEPSFEPIRREGRAAAQTALGSAWAVPPLQLLVPTGVPAWCSPSCSLWPEPGCDGSSTAMVLLLPMEPQGDGHTVVFDSALSLSFDSTHSIPKRVIGTIGRFSIMESIICLEGLLYGYLKLNKTKRTGYSQLA